MRQDKQFKTFYILKTHDGHCQIVAADKDNDPILDTQDKWGPYSSQEEAIARRVGLIRAGKCQPE